MSFFCRYPKGYFVQDYAFDFFNYAGIHRLVRFYTTPQVFISDITVVTDLTSDNTNGTLRFKTLVLGSQSLNDSFHVSYKLFDAAGKSVANISGLKLLIGKLEVHNVQPWWPIGMSDNPGYLYYLKVLIKTSVKSSICN